MPPPPGFHGGPGGGPLGCLGALCGGISHLVSSCAYFLCCCCLLERCCGPIFGGGPHGPGGPGGPGGGPHGPFGGGPRR